MPFNSFSYFLLLGSCLLISSIAWKNEQRVWILLIFSYAFYSFWDYHFTAVLIFSTGLNYILGKQIFKSNKENKGRSWLTISICANLAILIYFKVILFFNNFQSKTAIYVPVGISFYTFQALSYCIDIYRGKISPERSILNFALYVSFFPQILAGPIERASKLLPQISTFIKDKNGIFFGFKIIFFGIFKKIIVADKLALIIDPVFENPSVASGQALFLTSILFYFQIYCDFSGYTDIALGSARLFGIKLTDNFKRPYLAVGQRDFWHRWHITLSNWFRDYVYFPLGGNNVSKCKWFFNIMLIFTISGIWHGVGLTFLLWGILHALFYILDTLLFKRRFRNDPIWKNLRLIITFLIVSVLWIPFRAVSISDTFLIFRKVLSFSSGSTSIINQLSEVTELNYGVIYLIGFILLFFILIDASKAFQKFIMKDEETAPTSLDLLLINSMIIIILLLGDWGGERFIYFQF